MPYSKISELPDSIKVLPADAQSVFMRVVNSALEKGDGEETAFKKAWGAVKRAWDKNKDGEWVKKMADNVRFLIPFSEPTDSGGWRLFFPFKEVHHMGMKVNFTRADGAEMVNNFKLPVPDYPLPINERHDDGAGIYGRVADLRVGENGVEWRPEFNDGAAKSLRDKGYMYASPEIQFRGYVGVYDGKEYNNVALGVAITPRPRLGAATLVFSDGEWAELEDGAEGDAEDTIMEEQNMSNDTALNEESVKEIARDEVRKNFGEWVMSLFEHKPSPADQAEALKEEPGNEQEENHDDVVREYSEKLSEKDAQIAALQDALAETERRVALFEEQKEAAVRAQRLMEFSEIAEEIPGLTEAPAEFAETLMWLNDIDATEEKVHYSKILAVLKVLGKREAVAALFTEAGHDGQDSETVEAKIGRLVAEKVAGGATQARALQELFSEQPELYAEYNRKNLKPIRNSGREE
jgi:cation transport regulator ChaB